MMTDGETSAFLPQSAEAKISVQLRPVCCCFLSVTERVAEVPQLWIDKFSAVGTRDK